MSGLHGPDRDDVVEAFEAILPQGGARERMSDEEVAECIHENEAKVLTHLRGEELREGELRHRQ